MRRQRRSLLARYLVPALVILFGLAAGAGSAVLVARRGSFDDVVRVGPWQAQLAAGSQNAGLYTRAHVAMVGLLALDRRETLYFVAGQDDGGRPLRGDCVYDVSGRDPPGRWWSITAYGPDHFLVDNAPHRFSFNGASVTHDAAGLFHIRVAGSAQPGDWLPAPSQGAFILTLRLYNPEPGLAAAPDTLKAPAIVPVGVCDGG